jgi:hypothetical protein
LITDVVSLIVAVIVEQREFMGKAHRDQSRPYEQMGWPAGMTFVEVVEKVMKTVLDHSSARSTYTFSEGT